AAGRRPGRAPLARDARPGRRLGHRARLAGRDRGGPPALARRRPTDAVTRLVDILPDLVRDLERLVLRQRARLGQWRLDLLRLAGARPRRHDVVARHDRELARIEWRRVGWRVRWRW